jgi:hypothetical protein
MKQTGFSLKLSWLTRGKLIEYLMSEGGALEKLCVCVCAYMYICIDKCGALLIEWEL